MRDHTKGNWVADNNEGFSAWNIWQNMAPSGSGTAGRLIASIYGDDAASDADARLIAAAPELLEALELCLRAVLLAGWGGDCCAEKARAALAKARGEA